MKKWIAIALAAAAFSVFVRDTPPAFAQQGQDITLPAPQTRGGMPLMEALAQRRSAREFSPRELPSQMLSDLLWAAAGINRPDSGKRTAPTARNMQEIEVYAVLPGGAYCYDPQAHALRFVAAGDLRPLTGMQPFVAAAPLNLVYVADLSKMGDVSPEGQTLYSGTDTGFISENVYLFAASAGLATVVRGSVEREALTKALALGADRKIVLTQTVGYPAAPQEE